MRRLNLIAFILLMALTLLVGQVGLSDSATIFIMILKVGLITFIFMDLREAHLVYKLASAAYVLFIGASLFLAF